MTYLWVACFNTQKRPTLLCLASHEKGPKLLECAKYINLTHAYTHKKRNALRLRGGFGFCTLISARCYDWLFLTSDQVCFSRKSKKKKSRENSRLAPVKQFGIIVAITRPSILSLINMHVWSLVPVYVSVARPARSAPIFLSAFFQDVDLVKLHSSNTVPNYKDIFNLTCRVSLEFSTYSLH